MRVDKETHLLSSILLQPLLGKGLLLLINLLIRRPKQVNLLLLILNIGGGRSGRFGQVGGDINRGITGKAGEIVLVGVDVLVPSCGVGVLARVGCSGECLVGNNVGLGWSVSNDVATCLQPIIQVFDFIVPVSRPACIVILDGSLAMG